MKRSEQDHRYDEETSEMFETWWQEDGQYIDPDTDDVPWFDKRKGLAGSAFRAALPQPSPSQVSAVGVEELRRLRAEALALTRKHGDPNGTDYEQGVNDHGARWVGQLDAALSVLPSPGGWRAAPAEPTSPMLDAACDVGPDTNSGAFSWDDARSVYLAMLAAAPSPPQGGDGS